MNQEESPIQNPNPIQDELPIPAEATEPAKQRPGRKLIELTAEQRKKIRKYHQLGYGTRKIGSRLRLGRKRVRAFLIARGLLKPDGTPAIKRKKQSKLDPYRDEIRKKVLEQQLTAERILREITANGYTGGRSILTAYIRLIRLQPVPKKKVHRRLETGLAEEMQGDWSPYRVSIAGRMQTVHVFLLILAFSRKAHARGYPNERQSTLLEAMVAAFEDFGGVCRREVLDWMSTVVLGSTGPKRDPIWHPRFLEFAHYYGFEPYLCKVCDPDRKGKAEKFFWRLERDFIRGREFESLEDFNAQLRVWLDTVANRKVHGTTRRVPDEAFAQERPFLIPLPGSPFPACDEELRQVGPDSVISVRGTPYTVPWTLAHKTITVRLYARHFEVLDLQGQSVMSRPYVPDLDKGRLVINPEHYPPFPNQTPHLLPSGPSTHKLTETLSTRFPSLLSLLQGLKAHMKGLSHVHLRALIRLADEYGDEAFLRAAERAQHFKRFDSLAIQRILEKDNPQPEEQPIPPLTAAARVLAEIGEVDSGSLEDYAYLDQPQVSSSKASTDPVVLNQLPLFPDPTTKNPTGGKP
jgi:transposase